VPDVAGNCTWPRADVSSSRDCRSPTFRCWIFRPSHRGRWTGRGKPMVAHHRKAPAALDRVGTTNAWLNALAPRPRSASRRTRTCRATPAVTRWPTRATTPGRFRPCGESRGAFRACPSSSAVTTSEVLGTTRRDEHGAVLAQSREATTSSRTARSGLRLVH